MTDYCDELGSWNFTELHDLLPNPGVSKIASIWIKTDDPDEDSRFCKLEGDGIFYTKICL